MQSTEIPKPIEVVTLLFISDRRILLVRSRANAGFYLPGGKREPFESDTAALRREIHEELGCRLFDAGTEFFAHYDAQAYGRPAGTMVSMNAYRGTLLGVPQAQAEISEIRYFTFREYMRMTDRAPAAELALSDLVRQGLIAQ